MKTEKAVWVGVGGVPLLDMSVLELPSSLPFYPMYYYIDSVRQQIVARVFGGSLNLSVSPNIHLNQKITIRVLLPLIRHGQCSFSSNVISK